MDGKTLKVDSNHDKMADSKCGEVFVSENTRKLLFYCVFCNDFYTNVELFSEHILELHLFLNLKNHEETLVKSFRNSLDGENKELKSENASEHELKSDIEIEEVKVEVNLNHNLDITEPSNNERLEVEYITHDSDSSQSIETKGKKKTIMKKVYKYPRRRRNEEGRTRVPKGFWKCQICSEIKKKVEKSAHLKTHDVVKRFICETCGKGYNNRCRLNTHSRTHTGERPYKCEFCDQTFKCLQSRQQHNKTHFGLKPHTCSYCGSNFTSKHSLRKHEFMHTTNGEKNVQCDLCEKKFSTEFHMQDHRKRHKFEEKAFQCPKCPKGFSTKYACNAHERLDHLGQYNYKCDYCDKGFIKLCRKQKHEKTHTRVGQPFPCDLCDKKYANREGLFKHKKRIHFSNKPIPEYKCNKCGEIFKEKTIFNEHCKQHTLSENHFICMECGARFNTEIKLSYHKTKSHILKDPVDTEKNTKTTEES